MTTHQGFKITRTDGTTHNGYRWPLPMPGERIRVEATQPTEHDDPCPQHEGDGLCVALTAKAASSGGIRLASCIGLLLEYDDADILAEGGGKVRVRAVDVTGIFDVLTIIKAGLTKDLTGANLLGANLTGAYLTRADLLGANLLWAYLTGADITGANLLWANLTGANLTGANLLGANLTGADLLGAYLTGANLTGAIADTWTRWPVGFVVPNSVVQS
jgi:hypothetical protein